MAPTNRTDYLSNDNRIEPPGLSRPFPEPTETGHIPFSYAPTGVSGAKTFYKLWGSLSSGQPPLIGLHGGPGIPHDYLLSLSLLHTDYGIPVLLYDQIGCGGSTRFPARKHDAAFWPTALFRAELDNLRSHLGIKAFDLYGQSWGGMLAGEYAATAPPAGLRKLVISNSPSSMALWEGATNVQRAGMPPEVRAALDAGEAAGPEGLESEGYMAATMKFYAKHTCRLTTWPPELERAFALMMEDPTVYHTMMGPNEFSATGTLKTWDVTEQLKTITEKTVPGGLLVLNGFYDAAQDDVTAAYFWSPSCRTKWVRFDLSAHLPHLEEGEKYLRTLGDFLTT